MFWVASLGPRVQPKTIKAYLTHLRSLHVDPDLPFHSTEAPVVQRLIRGIKRYHRERDRKPKLPVTLDVLTCIRAQLNVTARMYASCCLAFAALLRCGEFTVNGATFNAGLHLSRGGLSFVPDVYTATHVLLALPASKTVPFRKMAPGARTRAVAALWGLVLSFPAKRDAPLFCMPGGRALTRFYFIGSLRDHLATTGFDARAYSGHSFRRGGTSSAAAAGFSEHEIQLLGRWRSDAYKLYIDVPIARPLQLSSRVPWVQSPTHHPKLPFLRDVTSSP